LSRRVLSFARVPQVHFCTIGPERNPGSRVMYLGGTIAGGSVMPDKQINSEGVMAGLYLGIAVAGVNALVAMGLVIASM
jgi:hypothetical protein